MAARRRRDEPLVMRLGAGEVALLERLLGELDDLASVPPGDDPVSVRLHVAGYADATAAADFRELTQTSLQSERRDRYAQCRAELAESAESAGSTALTGSEADGCELVIEASAVSRWLMVFNDMRLELGTRLGVTAEGFADPAGDGDGIGPGDDIEVSRAVYHWLTAVQDGLVSAAMA